MKIPYFSKTDSYFPSASYGASFQGLGGYNFRMGVDCAIISRERQINRSQDSLFYFINESNQYFLHQHIGLGFQIITALPSQVKKPRGKKGKYKIGDK